MSGIDITSYTNLNKYSILAGAGITSGTSTTITPNYSYGSHPTPTYTGGPFIGTLNQLDASAAQTDLTTLISDINILTPSGSTSGGGSQTFYPGVYTGGAMTFNSGATITLDGSGNTNSQFFFISGSAITFTSVAEIRLINGASSCNVFWLAGSSITFGGTQPQPAIPGIFIASQSITFANAAYIVGRVYANVAAVTLNGNSTVNGVCTSDPDAIVCYAKGTLILTQRGLVPIEKLKAGQSIITKGKINFNKYHNKNANIKAETLLWVSKFKVVDLNSKSRPICIKKDALGENRPFKDLYVSPGHSLLLNGEMVRANRLINGTTIYQDNECDDVEYYHVELDSHSAVFANGILSESYLALNNRHVFENSISLRIKPKFNFKNIRSLR